MRIEQLVWCCVLINKLLKIEQEGENMKNRASARNKFGGELWRGEALLLVPG